MSCYGLGHSLLRLNPWGEYLWNQLIDSACKRHADPHAKVLPTQRTVALVLVIHHGDAYNSKSVATTRGAGLDAVHPVQRALDLRVDNESRFEDGAVISIKAAMYCERLLNQPAHAQSSQRYNDSQQTCSHHAKS